MTDTTAFGDILTDIAVSWLDSAVTQQDKVDNPATLPAPTAADAQTRATAKVANTIFNALEDLNRWFNGLDAAGQAGGLARFLGGVSIADTATVTAGNGSPEGAVTAPVGSLYLQLDGGAGTTLYSKETGVGDTGWSAFESGGVFAGDVILDSASPTFTVGDGTDAPLVVLDKSETAISEILFHKTGAQSWAIQNDAGEDLVIRNSGGGTFVAFNQGLLKSFWSGDMSLSSANADFTVGLGTGSPMSVVNKSGGGTGKRVFEVAGVQSWQWLHDASEDFRLQRAGAVDVLTMTQTTGDMRVHNAFQVDGAFNHDGTTFGAMGATPVTRPSVTVDNSTQLLAALVALGLVTDDT